ncbi:MAG TPA: AMP-binding protein, partial [Longimicrobiales bacterium]
MTDKATLHNMIRRGAERGEDSAALLGTDGFRLTWRELSTQIDGIAGFLAEGGIEPGNRVGIMLPNGPEMAVSFLSVASVAAAAPLNPSFTAEELRFYLADLGVAAVIGPREPGDAIRSVGASLGIPVHALSRAPASDAPGFLMDGQVVEAARAFRAPAPTDTALLLHTSGTTSRPKLVPLSHANLRASAGSIRRSLGLISGDRCLNIMPLFHIHGLVCALLASLDAGGSVVCTGGLVARHFISWLQEFRPTWYTAVPTMHQAVLQAVGEEGGVPEGHSLRLIRSSSSALPKPVLEDLGATFGVPVVEAYGMTEASHQMCSNPLPPAVSKPGSVGPAAGPEVAVMDELGVLQPRGVAGEVVIRGDSVTAGYHGNPEANARAFTDGWFRTGDEGYLDEDGYLFLSGRLKEIINRGGEKVAPRQVDDVLLEHPDVLQAVTFAVPHGTLGEDVLAAVMLREGSGTTERDLRHHAFSKLAASRVPSRIVLVDDIPKGPSGKLKRIGLSERLAHLIRPGHEPPTTDTERLLAAVWSEVLVIESETIGAHDNFFTLGGDSLSAARVRGRVLRALGVDVPLEQLFREPTVQTLATAIDALREAPGDRPAERRPARVGREAPRVLSPAQERTWFLNRFAPDNPGDNRPANLRLRGPIEIPVLRRCLDEIVRRHEALRTSFQEMDGQPIAVVEPGAVLALDVVDASEDGEGGEGSARFRELVRDEARRPFDLTVAPLLRTTLVRLGRDDHALLTTFHHIVFDAWSMEVFVRELSLLYEAFSQGKASPLPPLSIQYADYAAWQRAWLEGDEANRQLRYWLEHLADAPATSELPILGDRPPHQLYDGRSESVPLPAALWPAIDRLCEEWRVTRFMVFFAVFQALIHRYTGQDAIVIGTPAADRQVPESEELIGVFVNTLPIRTDVSGDPSFAELLERTRSVVLNGLAHLQVPFERIVEAVAPDRDLSRTPLFQLFCNYRNVPLYRRADGGLQIEEMSEAKEIANFDLALEIDDEPAGIRCTLVYNTHLFEAERVSRMAGHFLTLLEGAVADASTPVSALPMVVGEELRRMLVEWNDTGVDWPSDTLAHEAIAEQAARTPDAVAVVCGDHRVTYRELNETANQLARHLQGLGIARGGLVGVFLDRSVDMVVALLGIAKAGAAFLPLDPAYPRERLAHMIRDGAPSLVITEGGLAEALPQGDRPVLRIDENREDVAREDAGDLDSRSSRGDLAYIMYTSGSTGQPKGVMVEHGSLMNFLWAMREAPGVSASDTMLAVTPLSFDPCLLELFLPLTCGAKVKIVARSVAVNGYELARELDDPEVTLFQATPATLQMLMDA